MPKLNLAAAKQIKNSAGEFLQLKAPGIDWQKRMPLPEGGEISIVEIDGISYRIHTFRESGTFEIFAPLEVEYFLVGGGASGGARNNGGGGGAGGRVRHNFGSPILLEQGEWSASVGAGGAGIILTSNGRAGDSSVFAGVGAEGGLGGSSSARGPGGNQGGAGGYVGGKGNPSVGHAGGGAGDGGNGGDVLYPSPSRGGEGGPGSYHNPDGNPRYFAGGGGGRGGGPGGVGGGTPGQGSKTEDAAPNTGAGTGGSYSETGAGGSGLVIVRYPYDPSEWVA